MINKFVNSFFRITTSGNYIPEVDGIRFLAIISVLFYHSNLFYTVKNHVTQTNGMSAIFANGYVGVYLFFVLSGYILSLPFSKQFDIKNSDGRINLKSYYLRRLTRLEPPYIICLIFFFIMLVYVTHKYPFSYLLPHFISSLFYLSDIIYRTLPIINVPLWTLEVEVQFYLIAPFLCLLIFRNKLSTPVRCLYLSISIVLLTILQSVITLPFSCLWQYFNFFLSGILLTEILKLKKLNYSARLPANVVSILILMVVFYFDYNKTGLLYHILINFLIIVLFLLILQYKSLNLFLANKYVCIIGGACYSIYLIHYPVISFVGNPLNRFHFSKIIPLDELIHIFIYLIVVIIISMVFYKICERPFMDKKWPNKLVGFFKKNISTAGNIKDV